MLSWNQAFINVHWNCKAVWLNSKAVQLSSSTSRNPHWKNTIDSLNSIVQTFLKEFKLDFHNIILLNVLRTAFIGVSSCSRYICYFILWIILLLTEWQKITIQLTMHCGNLLWAAAIGRSSWFSFSAEWFCYIIMFWGIFENTKEWGVSHDFTPQDATCMLGTFVQRWKSMLHSPTFMIESHIVTKVRRLAQNKVWLLQTIWHHTMNLCRRGVLY